MNVAQALGIAAAAFVTSFANGVPLPLQAASERAVAAVGDTMVERTPLRQFMPRRADAEHCRYSLY